MGQANRRGTREDRIQQALEREAAERDARRVIEEERQAWFDGLTPEEQDNELRRQEAKRRQRDRAMVAGLIGFGWGLGGQFR